MSTWRQRYTQQQFDGSHVEKQVRFTRDRQLEIQKTQELIKQIAAMAVRLYNITPVSYESIRDHEQINERLQDIVDDWKDV